MKTLLVALMLGLVCTVKSSANVHPTIITTVKEVKIAENKPKVVEPTNDTNNKMVVLTTPKVIVIKPKNEVINIIISYYTNSIENTGSTKGISASGKHLPTLSRGGTISVAAPKDIPFNTKIYIEGIGECNVQDRGGSITYIYIDGVKFMKIDLFIPNITQKKLMEKGIVKTTGYIIE